MVSQNVLTVSEINKYLHELVMDDLFLQDIFVSGEISNFKHHGSGHMYFTLKDERSALRCVFFNRYNIGCLFKPVDGTKVLARGHISIYERTGLYQLYVKELKPEGLGALYLAYEQLKKKLAAEGIFDRVHKKSLPRIPLKVAVVTSPTGAVIRDILKTIERRFPLLKVILVPAAVQGENAPREIVSALAFLNSRDDLDVIIIARGGGSFEELWAFNTEEVARAIFAAKVPVVTAIGHETDFCIADFVADLRASTPTAAAEMIAPDKEELLRQVSGWGERLHLQMRRHLSMRKEVLDHLVNTRAFRLPLERINQLHQQLDQNEKNLSLFMEHYLNRKVQRLKNLSEKLAVLSPKKLMGRGFIFCSDEHGKIIRSVRDMRIEQRIKLSLCDGEAVCRVENTEGILEESVNE